MSKDDGLDYERDLEIDVDDLEREWLEQPLRYSKYARLYADAEARVRFFEEQLKTIRSKYTLEAWTRDHIGTKLSAQSVEAWFRTQPRFLAVKKKWQRAMHVADILRNAMFAFQMRKTALEKVTDLRFGEFYSSPKEPRGEVGSNFREAMRTETQSRVTITHPRKRTRAKGR